MASMCASGAILLVTPSAQATSRILSHLDGASGAPPGAPSGSPSSSSSQSTSIDPSGPSSSSSSSSPSCSSNLPTHINGVPVWTAHAKLAYYVSEGERVAYVKSMEPQFLALPGVPSKVFLAGAFEVGARALVEGLYRNELSTLGQLREAAAADARERAVDEFGNQRRQVEAAAGMVERAAPDPSFEVLPPLPEFPTMAAELAASPPFVPPPALEPPFDPLSGPLACPKCKKQYGSYNHAGLKCGCNRFLSEGFIFVLSKVDHPPKAAVGGGGGGTGGAAGGGLLQVTRPVQPAPAASWKGVTPKGAPHELQEQYNKGGTRRARSKPKAKHIPANQLYDNK
ncbi:hypothetical protein TeGR_g7321 [Tetraparma gracilis]|uniref:Uncharacterized protein n=1 Tax=Tetraparma gracilis TaxID=2962635 RepID=A0ABQ6M3J4_9STRA|nr:hypothetical protein TeGR_g7321 [Tetraparma gracilis]